MANIEDVYAQLLKSNREQVSLLTSLILLQSTSGNQETIIANQTNGTQKSQIVDSEGENVGTTDNPLTIKSTDGLPTYVEQFTQTDLMNLILLELQEQTRILKKIYQ